MAKFFRVIEEFNLDPDIIVADLTHADMSLYSRAACADLRKISVFLTDPVPRDGFWKSRGAGIEEPGILDPFVISGLGLSCTRGLNGWLFPMIKNSGCPVRNFSVRRIAP